MGKERGNSANARGHQADREVYDAEGNPVEGMNQTAWQNRDKSAGLTRPEDAVVEELPAEEVPAEGEGEETPVG